MQPSLSLSDIALPQAVISQAIAWRIRLESGAGDSDLALACQHWCNADPLHALAWQRLAQMELPFTQAAERAPALARATLRNTDAARAQANRRQVLGTLAGSTLGVMLLGWGLSGSGVVQRFNADFATRMGERQQYRLSDSSQLWLNTDSAASVHFTANERRISLARGELWIDIAAEPRPLVVEAAQVSIHTKAAGLLVRQEKTASLVQTVGGNAQLVFAHAREPMRLEDGQVLRLERERVQPLDGNMFDYRAWVEGVFAVRNMPLKSLLTELGRYRRGVLRCAPALDNFQVSGIYQLRDTDLILHTLAMAASAEVRHFTRWWAELQPQEHA